jgi:hypothetical protein
VKITELLKLLEKLNEGYYAPPLNMVVKIDNRVVAGIEVFSDKTERVYIEYLDDIGTSVGYSIEFDFNIEIFDKRVS